MADTRRAQRDAEDRQEAEDALLYEKMKANGAHAHRGESVVHAIAYAIAGDFTSNWWVVLSRGVLLGHTATEAEALRVIRDSGRFCLLRRVGHETEAAELSEMVHQLVEATAADWNQPRA